MDPNQGSKIVIFTLFFIFITLFFYIILHKVFWGFFFITHPIHQEMAEQIYVYKLQHKSQSQ